MYAVIETQGKQHKVVEGQTLLVDRLEGEVGTKVDLKVLLVGEDGNVEIGTPYVENAKVEAKIVEHKKDKKVLVFKKKRRKQYKKLNGHRQPITVLKIEKIVK